MAMEPNLIVQETYFESDGDTSLKHKWNSISEPTTDLEKDSSCFDCSICFDSAKDPVVTLCGHLYCWPCIYKWLHIRTSSLDADPQPKNCPVCKANISSGSLVPLYGHGTSSQSQSKNPHSDMVIPQRSPPTSNITTTSHINHENFLHNQQYFPLPYSGYATLASSDLGGIAMTNFFHPMITMLGEMVYTRMFGSSNTSMFGYPNQASYPLLRNNNHRMRRQEIQVDKSLSRVSMFLFCCTILCLVLF
ncbi:choline transporter-like protein 2-like [Hibiscus syriacus]|uniref:E3 ubiquitin-protein ligase RMA n=1 Tax=Hibiscus syriacus TaxID=106335 RepID=A0A6A3AFB9_HIBSY|nr:E3 ubiquitin-protein ligase RMA3-like [Hibiscus syriacus]KAE8703250.1 choline transporter-like protein 2-like [Hibiscus syriacus]